MSRNSNNFFITISKYMRGSMTELEIETTNKYFQSLNPIELFIVNEHKNRDLQNFEHLHVYVLLKDEIRSDKLREKLKKNLSHIQHKNDVDIRQACDKVGLLGGYLVKTNDFRIVFNKGFTDEYLKECKEVCESNYELAKKLKTEARIPKNRIFKCDVPYVMNEFIINNELRYNGSLEAFTRIIKEMLLKNYDFELRNLLEIKAKLDLIQLGDTSTLKSLIEDQFKFISSPIEEEYEPPVPISSHHSKNPESTLFNPIPYVKEETVWDETVERIKKWDY